MRDIFIFDIDGCIMPNIFPPIEESKMENERINQELTKRAPKLSLFPEFIEFYKKNCSKSLAVYFITGRKQKYYGEITELHLNPLKIYKKYIIKHFPDDKLHSLKEYFNWKARTIKDIIHQWKNNSIRFYIFDDLEDLFSVISKVILLDNRDLNCKVIQKQNDWVDYVNII